MRPSRIKTRSIQGNPSGAILSESAGNSGSVQRLTARTDRPRTAYANGINTARYNVRRQCVQCSKRYTPTGPAQKRCVGCQAIHKKVYMQKWYKNHYVKKGYSQAGPSNNNWTGGIGVYRRLKKRTACERCSSKKHLLIHHKDGNRYNNELTNLECLCKRCHQIEHRCWESFAVTQPC
jgi:hypothetical protein